MVINYHQVWHSKRPLISRFSSSFFVRIILCVAYVTVCENGKRVSAFLYICALYSVHVHMWYCIGNKWSWDTINYVIATKDNNCHSLFGMNTNVKASVLSVVDAAGSLVNGVVLLSATSLSRIYCVYYFK